MSAAAGSALGYGAVFGLALALRGLYLYELRDSLLLAWLFGDGQQYDAWAREIAAGDWVGQEVFYQAPLYPYFLAVLYTIGGHSLALVRSVQCLLGAGACVLVAFAGTRWVSRAAGLCGGLLLAAHPSAVFFDGLIQKSSLDLFLTAAVLAALSAFSARPRWPLLVGLGVALAALTLNRENARVVYPIAAAWLLLAFRGASLLRRGAWVALFVAASACVLAPVAWRNYRVGGQPFLSTAQLGPNLFIGNHPGADGRYAPLVAGRGDARAERADAVRLAEEASGRTLTAREVSDYWTRRALAYVADEPASWLRLMAWKLFLTFNATELTDSESIGAFASQAASLRLLQPLGLGLLLPLAAFGAWATRRDWRRLWILYALVLGFAASVALFFVFARYRFPMVAPLAVLAGAGVAALPAAVRSLGSREGRRRWAPGLALAAALALPASWPLPQHRDDEITWYNLGVTLLDAGRHAEAASSLGEALRIEPDFGLAHYQLGRALAALGRHDDAERELALAAERLPDAADVHYAYAMVLIRRDSWSETALRHLRRAAALAPESAAAHVQIARTLALRGELAEAAREARIALRLAPGSPGVANDLAWILATHPDAAERSGAEAIALLEPLLSTPLGATPEVLDTLAAAYAEAGRFADAVATAARAEALAREAGRAPIADIIAARRRLYESGRPFRETLPATPP